MFWSKQSVLITTMSHSNRRVHDLQQLFVRQSVILRGNLQELDHQLHVGDNWQSMLGRLNAAAVSFVKQTKTIYYYYCNLINIYLFSIVYRVRLPMLIRI